MEVRCFSFLTKKITTIFFQQGITNVQVVENVDFYIKLDIGYSLFDIGYSKDYGTSTAFKISLIISTCEIFSASAS